MIIIIKHTYQSQTLEKFCGRLTGWPTKTTRLERRKTPND